MNLIKITYFLIILIAVTNEIIIDNVNIAISLKSNSFKAFSLKIPRKRIYKKASKNINTELIATNIANFAKKLFMLL